jgi:hypothetical protein
VETSDEYDRGFADAAAANPPTYTEDERRQFRNTVKVASGGDRARSLPRRNTTKNRDLGAILNEPVF